MRFTQFMRRFALWAVAPVLLAALLAALRGAAYAAPPAQEDAPASLAEATVSASIAETLAALREMTYTLSYLPGRVVTLTAGLYESLEPTLTVAIVERRVVTGDLDGDGAADAALLLASNTGGSEIFFDLALALWVGDRFVNVATLPLGDRTVVNDLRFDGGGVVVDMLVHAPGDEACCPTLPYPRRYVLEKGRLVEGPAVATARLFPYPLNGLYGYVNSLGQWVVRPQFIFADRFSEGMALISFDGSRFGFIDQQGRLAIPPGYAFATPFEGGLSVAAAVQEDEGAPPRIIYIDRRGANVFGTVTFAFGLPFSEGLAAVKFDDGKFGYIDRLGNVTINSQFDYALPFSEGLAPVLLGDRVGYTDRLGGMPIQPQFTSAGDFHGGLAPVMTVEGRSGYIDRTGALVIPPIFARAAEFSEGLAAVVTATVSGTQEVYIDTTGRAAIEQPLFTQAGPFVEGLAVVNVGNPAGASRFGYVDARGNLAIEPQFTAAESFADGLAVVQTRADWGVIRPDGSWLLRLPAPPPLTGEVVAGEVITVVTEGVTGTLPITDTVPAETPPAATGQPTEFIAVALQSSGEVRQGACSGPSQIVSWSGAWLCTANGETFDPCIVGPDGVTLTCDVDPADALPGFTLQLPEGLPERVPPATPPTGVWVIQLESGEVCRYNAATSITVEGQRINYNCASGSQLLGEINRAGPVWTIESVTTTNDGQGNYTVVARQPVNIAFAWLFSDQMPVQQ